MIDAVDATLATWLTRCCPPDTTVSFAAPDDDGATKPGKGVDLHVFLAEIRRDVQAQASDLLTIRDEDGHVTGRQQPVQWYRYGYQLTAHAASTQDEHRVLGAVLVAAAAEPVLPEECRTGALAAVDLPILIRVGSPIAERSTETAQARPTATILDLVLVAPLVPAPPEIAAPPVTRVAIAAENLAAEPAEDDDKPKRRPRNGSDQPAAARPSFRSTHTLTEYPVRPTPSPRRRKAGQK